MSIVRSSASGAVNLCDILRELVALCETNGFLLAVSKEQIVRPCSS